MDNLPNCCRQCWLERGMLITVQLKIRMHNTNIKITYILLLLHKLRDRFQKTCLNCRCTNKIELESIL